MTRKSASRPGHILCVLLASTPSAAFAQSQNSAIAGVVKDASGAALSAVTVEASSPALIEKKRVTVTDGQGTYKIVELRPGSYTVTFARTGFTTVKQDGIELPSSFTATINADMQVGTPEQIQTVSGTNPIVDTQNVSQSAVASRQVMDALPTDRNFISFAAMAPGVSVLGGGGLQNVGGSMPETGLMLSIHGSRVGESRLFVDGMSVMSGHSTGGVNFGNFLNNAMAQSVVVNTDSMSAEFELSGVLSNFITREGSNAFLGSFTGRYTNTSLQGENLSSGLVARGLTSGNTIEKIWDANPSLSAPLVRDRLWLFSSVRHWGTYNFVAGLYDDVDRTALFYTPDLSKPSMYPVWHATADARLTFKATPRNKVTTYYSYQYTDFGTCTSPAPTRLTAPSACPHNKNDPQWFGQVAWNSLLSDRVLIEAGGTLTIQNAVGHRDPGVPADVSAITNLPEGFSWRAPPGGFGGTRNNQSNYRAAMSYVTGTHATKVGLTLMQQWRITGFEHNNSVNYTFLNSVPNQIRQFAEPANAHERVNYNLGLYAQDQWTLKRLTLNLGLRADFLNAQVDAQSVPAGPLIGSREFAEINDLPNWRDLSPRLGAAYDLVGNGKTALKATLGRYVQGESYGIAQNVNPLNSTVPSATRTWNDSNGNFKPDCDLKTVAANNECGAANPNTFGQVIVRTRYDDGITEGFGVRPYNWGASLSVQHELFPHVSISGGYFRRWFGNFNNVTQNLEVTNADFTQYCIDVPVDSRLPGGGGSRLCGFYDVSVAKFGQANNLIRRAETIGEQEDVFDGFDFSFNARLPDHTVLSGGIGLGRERTNNCYGMEDRSLAFTQTAATTSRTTLFCDVRPPLNPNVKLQAIYPWPRWGIQTAATFQSLPGASILAQQTTTNAEIRQSLGRNLATCQIRPDCNASVTLDLLPRETVYGDRINQVDIRFTKTIRTGRTIIRPAVSVYNLFNANPVLRYSSAYDPSWPAPTAILTARFMDFGVQVDF